MNQQPTDSDPFADIRPYDNSEAPEVLARLARDPELVDALSRLRLPTLFRWMPFLARPLVGRWLRQQLGELRTIEDLQSLIEPQLAAVINRTATFTHDGLAKLDAGQSFVFVSNHRDIVMDPALANFALHRSGHRTQHIAIGSNLLQKPWVADLMRLNRSFVVKRDVSGPRELLAASKQLSAFIRHVITVNAGPVWIAQREGRAKDGRDETESAVIKMLSLSRDRNTESIGDVLGALNIVPIAISYEIDPCDVRKAREVAAGDSYQKEAFEDVASIGLGITGYKGCVHLAFGEPILGAELDVDTVVSAIDRQIIDLYALFPTNVWAWERLHGKTAPSSLPVRRGMVTEDVFSARVADCPEAIRPQLLAMYANPVSRWLEQNQEAAAIAG